MSTRTRTHVVSYIPSALIVLSILLCIGFARFYLSTAATDFAADFVRQNNMELQSADVITLSKKLDALTTSLRWKCVVASRNETPFFTKINGDCEPGFLYARVNVTDSADQGIAISFTFGLPPALLIACGVFISLQLILLLCLRITIRSSERIKHATDLSIAQIATQVAHDIRSPLAALDVVVQHTAELPEDTRLMIRSAVSRIRDIANGLLEKNRGLKRADDGEKIEAALDARESSGIYLISSLIDPLVTEKRMQFRSRIGIEIDARLDVSSYGLFAKIAPTEFKRVISNLINNSVEALGERGSVSISLSGSDKNIAITVQDNGKGIPPEIVAKLGIRGETHGKAGGSGLGLYHARSSVESWGGKLEIASEIGKGTSVNVTLPRAKPPDWFVLELKIESSSTVVIADDDASIHQIWDGRFESIRANEKDIELLHFSTPEELSKWAGDRGGSGRKTIYLIDHEFIGDQRTGLDVIEHLNLGRKAILVTSRYEEKAILDGCRKLGVRLIPKGMAGFVPISISAAVADKDSPDLVLIDDDDSIHITWRFSAKKNGKTIRAYSRPDDFFAEEKDFSRSLPIYVDANLGNDVHGDEVAKQIHDLGFTDIYLATGYQAKDFARLTFLKGIQGKDPPW